MIRNPQINWSYFLSPFIKFKAWYKRQSFLHVHGLNPERHKMRGLTYWVPQEYIDMCNGIHSDDKPSGLIHCKEISDGVVPQYFNPNKVYQPIPPDVDKAKIQKAIDEMWKEF